jgi:hypothetical protein
VLIILSVASVIFVGFGVLAPPNATTVFADDRPLPSPGYFPDSQLDQPFGELIGISEPMLKALHQLAQ